MVLDAVTVLATDAHNHDDHGDHDTVLTVKIVLIVVLPLIVIFFASLPFILSLCVHLNRIGKFIRSVLEIGQGFAAGILVAGAVLHIFPEVSRSMEETLIELNASADVAHYPFVSLVALLTFCFIYFSEVSLGRCLQQASKKRMPHQTRSEDEELDHAICSPGIQRTFEDPEDPQQHQDDVSLDCISLSSQREKAQTNITHPATSNNGDKTAHHPTDEHAPNYTPSQHSQDDSKITESVQTIIKQIDSATDEPPVLTDTSGNEIKRRQKNHYNADTHSQDEHNSSNAGRGHHHNFDLLIDHHTSSIAKLISRGLILWLSLSLHSFLTGLGVGSENNSSQLWTLITAIVLHKFFEAYALGDVLRAGMKKKKVLIAVILLIMYSITTSVGTCIGLAVGLGQSAVFALVSSILLSMAIGALLHVGLFELLFHHMISNASLRITIPYVFFFLLGIGGVAVISIFHGGNHDH